jgi:HEPN domain-containing protein
VPHDVTPGSAEDWLIRAKGKLGLARQPLPEGCFWEDLAYMAQQAAELAIKAVYQHFGWRFDFVHNIGHLLGKLEDKGLHIPDEIKAATDLTIYATVMRYPGMHTRTTKEEHDELLAIADEIVAWAEGIVGL